MLSVSHVYDQLRASGVSFFTGVPDSLLKDFCAYVTDHSGPGEHIIAANEGGAVALGAGHYLATGELALVYMQNSGFGNAVNPLLSLADPEIYGIPMVVLVGWRGEPGRKDEPQHLKQGRVMERLLEALELPYSVLEAGLTDPEDALASACDNARARGGPFVLLAKSDTFTRYELQTHKRTEFPLDREAALQLIVGELEERHVVVCTTGKASRELFEYRLSRGEGHSRDFLTVGSMGHASLIALGVALRRPECPVYCLDGDGAVLMHMGALPIIGTEAGSNFKHIVLNNGSHDSVGGQPTVGWDIDLPAIAKASGYRLAVRAETSADILQGLDALERADGPSLLEVRVNQGARADLGRPTSTPVENRDGLIEFLRTQGAGR